MAINFLDRTGPDAETQGNFGHELSDPGWRRWFDILKELGVTNIGGSLGGGLGISQPTSHQGYSQRTYQPAIAGLQQYNGSSYTPKRGPQRLET